MSNAIIPTTYDIGSGKYPKSAAGLAECAFDDLQNNACFREYCEADPIKRSADALQRLESCPATVSTVACFPNATACIPMSNGIGADGKTVIGFKPIAQKIIGLGATWLRGEIKKEIVLYVLDTLKSIDTKKQPRQQYQVEVFVHDSRIVSAGSQFGHVSIAIGDKLYSMSHSGLFQGITDIYIARQQTFRDSIGFVLDVSPEEAQKIEAKMLSFDGTSYDLLTIPSAIENSVFIF